MVEFRQPNAATNTNARALQYLTESLADPQRGSAVVRELISELGNVVDLYPDWHPLITIPTGGKPEALEQIKAYDGLDHTVYFVRGFVTCPYDDESANRLVQSVNSHAGLYAYQLEDQLYHDMTYPVVVRALELELDGDGTVHHREVLKHAVSLFSYFADNSEVAETWWTLKDSLLGQPSGARSSLFVNQNTGRHLRKILETLNGSGVFGPIQEWSLLRILPNVNTDSGTS